MTFLNWVYSQGIEHTDLFWVKAAWEQSAKVTKENEMSEELKGMTEGIRGFAEPPFPIPKEKSVPETDPLPSLVSQLTKLVTEKLNALAEENQRLFDRISDLEAKVEDIDYKVESIDEAEINELVEKVESFENDLEDLKETLRNV